MEQQTYDEIMKWMSSEENIKKLSMSENAQITLALVEFAEKIAPIVLKHMTSEEKTTFLFKL